MKVVQCYTCKMQFGMPDAFCETMLQLREKGEFYCPAGHAQHFVTGKSEAEKAREEAERARRRAERAEQNVAMWREEAETEKRRAAGYKGAATRLKNRARAGVCPCCNRTFQDLARHMATKHPDAELDNVVEFGQRPA